MLPGPAKSPRFAKNTSPGSSSDSWRTISEKMASPWGLGASADAPAMAKRKGYTTGADSTRAIIRALRFLITPPSMLYCGGGNPTWREDSSPAPSPSRVARSDLRWTKVTNHAVRLLTSGNAWNLTVFGKHEPRGQLPTPFPSTLPQWPHLRPALPALETSLRSSPSPSQR